MLSRDGEWGDRKKMEGLIVASLKAFLSIFWLHESPPFREFTALCINSVLLRPSLHVCACSCVHTDTLDVSDGGTAVFTALFAHSLNDLPTQ